MKSALYLLWRVTRYLLVNIFYLVFDGTLFILNWIFIRLLWSFFFHLLDSMCNWMDGKLKGGWPPFSLFGISNQRLIRLGFVCFLFPTLHAAHDTVQTMASSLMTDLAYTFNLATMLNCLTRLTMVLSSFSQGLKKKLIQLLPERRSANLVTPQPYTSRYINCGLYLYKCFVSIQ